MQNLVSFALLGGTSLTLLGGCLMQTSGAITYAVAGIAFFFAVGFFAHFRTLGRQD